MVLGGTRASYLLYDLYESEQRLAAWLSQLLFNFSFPCLTSAFCLILYVFMSVTKLQLVSKKLQNVSFFLVVIAFHFTVVLVAVILSVLNSNIVTIIFIFCHMFFIVWGLSSSLSRLHLQLGQNYPQFKDGFRTFADRTSKQGIRQSRQSYLAYKFSRSRV